ncbi:peptidase C14, caspase domain-containing protein [Rhodocollybia butyracea]|uniref:Peptidase C14, caspase domain-containing protein n=1 Tax=Rhodocollybia butyracea TaxID=206335 RepID=A0A9P5PT46_9AGAR|nr:peptidase C14, caspase domain-containing protein [Rhodocollybia butyracea]
MHLHHTEKAPENADGPVLTVERTLETKTTTRKQWISSNCTGNKKALVIGINYSGTANALEGCHSDASRMYQFITQTYGFSDENIVVLKDDRKLKQEYQPTKANIVYWMQWLVKDAQPHDSLFFHYSGHGGQLADRTGDEMDFEDDCIFPVDSIPLKHASQHEIAASRRNIIIDDDLHLCLVSPLAPGVRLTAVFDSCHSGSVLDLPFMYAAASGKLKEGQFLAEQDAEKAEDMRHGRGVLAVEKKETWKIKEKAFEVKDILEATKEIFHETAEKLFVERSRKGALMDLERLDGLKTHVKQAEKAEKGNESLADVVLISGCKDTQTSADASEDGVPTGALSWALMATLKENPEPTYLQLLDGIRAKLKKERYSQLPQLSTGHPMDLSTVFFA